MTATKPKTSTNDAVSRAGKGRLEGHAKTWFYLTGLAVALAAVVPWFSHVDPSSKIESDWSLLRDVTCYAHVRVEPCRTRWLGGWTSAVEMTPIFLGTRLAAIAAVVALFSTFSGKIGPRITSMIAGLSILVFAVHVAALPGDAQLDAVEPSWGAWLGLGGAFSVYLRTVLLDAGGADVRRRKIVATLVSAAALAGSLWLPLVAEPDAIGAQTDTTEAYSYASLASRFHWHGVRARRDHYMEDSLAQRKNDVRRWLKDERLHIGVPVAASGLLLAAFALGMARHDAPWSRRNRLVVAGAALLATAIWFATHVGRPKERVVPSYGALAIALALAGSAWLWWKSRPKESATP